MANLDTLVNIGEKSARIAELEAEAEDLRIERAALMEDARKEGASLEAVGAAADMTHAAVRKSIETFGRKSPRAKSRRVAKSNAARRLKYAAMKPSGSELEERNASRRRRYEESKPVLEGAGQSDRQS